MSALLKDDFGRVLSDAEQELASEASTSRDPEFLESLLYQHLHVAQQARLRMDDAKAWSPEYHRDFLARENALERARRHYYALREIGPIDPFLEQLATMEDLRA